MKVTLENTTTIVELDGATARVWEGVTESGIPIHAYIVRVAVEEGRDQADYRKFEEELRKCRPPTPAIASIPLSLIL